MVAYADVFAISHPILASPRQRTNLKAISAIVMQSLHMDNSVLQLHSPTLNSNP